MPKARKMSLFPWVLLAGAWTLLILILLFIGFNEYKKHIYKNAEILAEASYAKDLLYRRWASLHGGVYVPVTEETPPNPYLTQVEERDIRTPSGRQLTLLNPAYMMRQAHEMAKDHSSIQGHLTSLKPIRPENAADPWETEGLRKLAAGSQNKIVEQVTMNGAPYLRAIYPMTTEEHCLKCHADQGYKLGDLRGGISVSVPLTPFLPIYNKARNTYLATLGSLWFLGLAVQGWSLRSVRRQFRRSEDDRQRAALAEARYRTLFNEADYGIALVDPQQGVIIECNQALIGLLGESGSGFAGQSIANLPGLEKIALEVPRQELEQRAAGGERRHLEIRKREIQLSDERYEQWLFHDRTEQVNSQRNLLASAQRINDIFQAAQNIAFVIASSEDKASIIEFSPGAERIFGYRKSEILGKPVTLLYAPDSDIVAMRNRLLDEEVPSSGRVRLRRKSGEIFPALFSLYPLHDDSGELYGGLGVSIDISELIELEERLRQAQKMEAIGTLAGGIAHDFNNILSIIFGYTQLASRHVERGTKLDDHLRTITTAANRAKELVSQILTFSRKTAEKKQPLELMSIVKEGIKLLRATLPQTIAIEIDIAKDCRRVNADPTQMHQVLMNLCTNAYQAMRQAGGTLSISLRNCTVSAEDHEVPPNLPPGDYVRLRISDTGCGIKDEILPRIFDPFFTTKLAQEGTGMGLSVVHGIIQKHGGVVSVNSKLGKGSSFSIYLPALPEDISQGERASKCKGSVSGHERILMIDDEPMLAALGRDLLSALGYQVKSCTDSRKALELIRYDPQGFDLIVTDQTMPYITGSELCREIQQLQPELPVIICTGFSELVNQENYRKFGARKLLSKPLEKDQLAQAIREVFEEN